MSLRETFSNTNFLPVTIEHDQGAVMLFWTVFVARLPDCLSKHPLTRVFLDVYLTTFSESITLKIQNLRRPFFYSKCLKFKLDFKNASKNWEKAFCFWYNCIWIGVVKFSLWRTRYFSSTANVLTSFCMSIRETFSNSVDLAVSNEYVKVDVMQISTVLGPVYLVASQRVLWNATF